VADTSALTDFSRFDNDQERCCVMLTIRSTTCSIGEAIELLQFSRSTGGRNRCYRLVTCVRSIQKMFWLVQYWGTYPPFSPECLVYVHVLVSGPDRRLRSAAGCASATQAV